MVLKSKVPATQCFSKAIYHRDRIFGQGTDSLVVGAVNMACGNNSRDPTSAEVYGYGTLAVVVVCCCSFTGASILLCSCGKSSTGTAGFSMTSPVLQFAIGLAIGCLTGDAIFHLVPQVIGVHPGHGQNDDTNHIDPSSSGLHSASDAIKHHAYIWPLLGIIVGMLILFIMERIFQILCGEGGHGHSHGGSLSPNVTLESVPDKQFPASIGDLVMGHGHSHGGSLSPNVTLESVPDKQFPASIGDLVMRPGSTHGGHVNVAIILENPPDKQPTNSEADLRMEDEIERATPTEDGVFLGLRPLALAIIVGDALHKIADGIALGAAFSVSPSSGLSTTIATVCHEVPHEIGDFAVLLAVGVSVRNALLLNLASSFTALIGFYAVASATGSEEVQCWLLAITAGMFLHIALNDMMQELKGNSWGWLVLHCSGFFFGWTVMLLLAIFEEEICI
uniref:zinc transporter ZIP4-like n=1 Tax=Myxine glutinosa TaxID=7769 RepID=UPI00358F525E